MGKLEKYQVKVRQRYLDIREGDLRVWTIVKFNLIGGQEIQVVCEGPDQPGTPANPHHWYDSSEKPSHTLHTTPSMIKKWLRKSDWAVMDGPSTGPLI